MDEFILLAVLITLTILSGSILGLVAFGRTRDLRDRLARIEAELRALKGAAVTAHEAEPVATTAEAVAEPVIADTVEEPASKPPVAEATAEPAADVSPKAAIATPKTSLEERIGTRWAVWVGGLALGLGGIFLVRYSIEAGLIGPLARVLLGLLFAAVLLAGSELLRRSGLTDSDASRRAYVPGILAAAGAVSAFASVYAAHALYGLIGPAIAFIGLGAVGVATLALALRHGPALAGLGFVAAYATPLLVSSAEPALLPLVLYLAMITVATYAVARLRLWRWLAVAGTVGNVVWSLALTGGGMADFIDPTASLHVAAHLMISLALAAIVFVTSHAPRDRGADAPFDRTATAIFSLFILPLYATAAAFGGGIVGVIVTSAYALLLMALAAEWPAARGLAVVALVGTVLSYAVYGTTIVGMVLDPVSGEMVTGGFAHLIASPDGNAYLGIGLLFGAILVVGGLVGALASRGRPQLAVAGAFAAPGLIAFAYIGTSRDLAVSPAFAVVALIAAGYLLTVTEYLGRRLADDAPGRDGAIAAYAIGTIATLGTAFAIAFEKGALTVALALMVAAIAWVEVRRPVAALRPTAAVLAGIVVLRFIWDPRVVGDDLGTTIIFNPLLYGYGVPTLAFAYTAWRFGRTPGSPRLVPLFEALAIVFAALTATLEIHHAMNGGDLFSPVSGLAEQSLLVMAMLSVSLGLNWISLRRGSKVIAWGTPLIGGLGLLMAAIGLLVVHNPLWSGEWISGGSFDGKLLIGYVTPAVLTLAVALIASRRPDKPRRYAALAATVGGLLIGLWATLAVRAGWHVGDLSWGDVAEGELYAYSAVWLVFGLSVLAAGVGVQSRAVRLVAAVIVAVVVGKVFLIDTAGLTGALRALSFIGLGGVLVAVGLGYQLVLRRR